MSRIRIHISGKMKTAAALILYRWLLVAWDKNSRDYITQISFNAISARRQIEGNMMNCISQERLHYAVVTKLRKLQTTKLRFSFSYTSPWSVGGSAYHSFSGNRAYIWDIASHCAEGKRVFCSIWN